MDEDRIGLVLARTSELRSKITNCIHKASSKNVEKESQESGRNESVANPDAENQEEDEEAESLLSIRDALESLEAQLSSLQVLQQQQWYEKEAALAEIEYSQERLLKQLKEYKGKDLVVIHEAIAFVGETEENNDLLLPPYPSRPSRSLVSDNGYISSFHSTSKLGRNGVIKDLHEVRKSFPESEGDRTRSPLKGMKSLISAAAKAALTIAGVMTVLSLAGFEPTLKKRESHFKISGLFRPQGTEGKGSQVNCPPGKVPVAENGEIRCVVKERVEVPFESTVATPDVSYGCG